MNPKSAKLLIAVFLVLATVTGAGTVALSSFFSWWNTKTAAPSEQLRVELGPKIPSISLNASVELLGENSPLARIGIESARTSSNLTDRAATNIANQIIRANPNGPQGADGANGLTAPKMSTLADELAEAARNVQIPDWEKEASAISVKIQKMSAVDDIGRYQEALRAIVEKHATESGVPNALVSGFATSGDVRRTDIALDDALRDIQKLAVPQQLEAFHRSFAKLLMYEKNVTGLAADTANDPLRAALILQAQEEKYENAIAELTAAAREQSAISMSSFQKQGFAELARAMFGVPVAHAQLVPTVAPHTDGLIAANQTTNHARSLWEWAQKLITENLKNMLIHKLTQQIIGWVQGNGKPQFVTNTKKFLADVADSAAGQALLDIEPGLCSSFRELVRTKLVPVQNVYQQTQCTFSQAVQNTQAFFDDFRTGGWIGYGSLFHPSNNFFGSVLQVRDIVLTQAEEAKEAAAKETSDNGGFLSTKLCVKEFGLDIENTAEAIEEAKANANYLRNNCGTVGGASGICQAYYCYPDGYETTTPGGTIAAQLNTTGLGSVMNRIVGADDFAALVSALINSGLNKLITAGVSGISRLGNGSNGGATAATSTAIIGNPCEGLTGAELNACEGGSGVLEQQRSYLLQTIDATISAETQTIMNGNRWENTATNVTSMFNTLVAQNCNSSIAAVGITEAQELTPNVQAILTATTNAKQTLQTLRGQVVAAATVSELDDLADQVANVDPTALQTAQEMSDRLDRLIALQSAVDPIFANLQKVPPVCTAAASFPTIAE